MEMVALPRSVVEALGRIDLTGLEYRIVSQILLNTYGQEKQAWRVTRRDIADLCGSSEQRASRTIKDLVDRGIVKSPIPSQGGRTGIYAVNTSVGSWLGRQEQLPKLREPDFAAVALELESGTEVVTVSNLQDDHLVLVENWHDGFYYCTGEDYPFRPRDGKEIKELLKTHQYPLELVQRMLVQFFELYAEDEWMQVNGALTVSHFRNRFANLLARAAKVKRDQADYEARLDRYREIRARGERLPDDR